MKQNETRIYICIFQKLTKFSVFIQQSLALFVCLPDFSISKGFISILSCCKQDTIIFGKQNFPSKTLFYCSLCYWPSFKMKYLHLSPYVGHDFHCSHAASCPFGHYCPHYHFHTDFVQTFSLMHQQWFVNKCPMHNCKIENAKNN